MPCISNHRDENCYLIVILLFFILNLFFIVMCNCIIIDLSYVMYNDPWRRNKSNLIGESITKLELTDVGSESPTEVRLQQRASVIINL
jgi:hypothetical protein